MVSFLTNYYYVPQLIEISINDMDFISYGYNFIIIDLGVYKDGIKNLCY